MQSLKLIPFPQVEVEIWVQSSAFAPTDSKASPKSFPFIDLPHLSVEKPAHSIRGCFA